MTKLKKIEREIAQLSPSERKRLFEKLKPFQHETEYITFHVRLRYKSRDINQFIDMTYQKTIKIPAKDIPRLKEREYLKMLYNKEVKNELKQYLEDENFPSSFYQSDNLQKKVIGVTLGKSLKRLEWYHASDLVRPSKSKRKKKKRIMEDKDAMY
jgi:hypothetical protein